MLSREDSRRLAQMERQLQRDDPEFCARMAGGRSAARGRKRVPVGLLMGTALLWMTAVVLGVLTWWVPAVLAFVMASVAASALAHRLVTRSRPHRE